MNTLALLVAALVVLPTPGHLVIVGGGGTPVAVCQRTLALAGGPAARVVILPQASARPNAGEGSIELWTEIGAVDVVILDPTQLDAACAAIEKADLIWLPGGSQSRLMEALAGTPLPAAIARRYAAGAVVAGTSAGAAVMSELMITGDAKRDRVVAGGTALERGLGLWPAVLVDQHFHARQRFNRLLSAVLDHPTKVGVGIDERTAVIVHGSSLEVVGESSALVLDARRAAVRDAETGAPQAAENVVLHLLTSGMTLDLAPREGQ